MNPTLNPLDPFTGQYVAPTAPNPFPVSGSLGFDPSVAFVGANASGTLPIPVSIDSTHKTMVSVIIIIVMALVFTQIAGVNHEWAVMVTLLLVGIVLALGMSNIGKLGTFSNNYPTIP